jgi:hypothetical protein
MTKVTSHFAHVSRSVTDSISVTPRRPTTSRHHPAPLDQLPATQPSQHPLPPPLRQQAPIDGLTRWAFGDKPGPIAGKTTAPAGPTAPLILSWHVSPTLIRIGPSAL